MRNLNGQPLFSLSTSVTEATSQLRGSVVFFTTMIRLYTPSLQPATARSTSWIRTAAGDWSTRQSITDHPSNSSSGQPLTLHSLSFDDGSRMLVQRINVCLQDD